MNSEGDLADRHPAVPTAKKQKLLECESSASVEIPVIGSEAEAIIVAGGGLINQHLAVPATAGVEIHVTGSEAEAGAIMVAADGAEG